ncbi:antitoxin [Methylosinus sporium]|uniref:Antitoxin n=1 Tax=Methylosinus sporium TaxID=428 RepID=A0A549SLZ3_METSR|nr:MULTISPECIES: antitoxin [Methylosinus]MBU3888074.1 antitoxin [Methylosinus sp. KRF6]TRL30635.1 antitoxin [Methylosinus sporium]
MQTAKLRKVGGSIMVAVPPAMLNALELAAESTVGLSVEGGRLIIEPQPQRRYSLDELLSEEAPSVSDRDEAWMNSPPVGRELL